MSRIRAACSCLNVIITFQVLQGYLLLLFVHMIACISLSFWKYVFFFEDGNFFFLWKTKTLLTIYIIINQHIWTVSCRKNEPTFSELHVVDPFSGCLGFCLQAESFFLFCWRSCKSKWKTYDLWRFRYMIIKYCSSLLTLMKHWLYNKCCYKAPSSDQ